MQLEDRQTNGQSIFANGLLDYFYKPTVPVASNFLRTPLQLWHSFSTDCIIMHVSSILSVYIETISLQLVVDTEATINPQPPHHRPHGHVKQAPLYCGLEVCPVRTHISCTHSSEGHSHSKTSAIIAMHDISTSRVFVRYKAKSHS